MKTFKVELLKLRNSKIFIITSAFPLLAVLLGWFGILGSKKALGGLITWYDLYESTELISSALLFPLAITVVIAMIARIEHDKNNWKQLFALPVKRGKVYFVKFFIGIMLLLYSLVVLWLGILVIGKGMGISGPIPLEIIRRTLLAYLSAFPIVAIQYYFSIIFSHISVPLAVGIVFTFPSILIANSAKYWIFYPWAYPVVVSSKYFVEKNEHVMLLNGICPILFILIIIVGLIQFNKRDIL